MADEILVDLNALFKDCERLGTQLGAAEQGLMLQIMATVALCERLDKLNNEVSSFIAWYQAVSPSQ